MISTASVCSPRISRAAGRGSSWRQKVEIPSMARGWMHGIKNTMPRRGFTRKCGEGVVWDRVEVVRDPVTPGSWVREGACSRDGSGSLRDHPGGAVGIGPPGDLQVIADLGEDAQVRTHFLGRETEVVRDVFRFEVVLAAGQVPVQVPDDLLLCLVVVFEDREHEHLHNHYPFAYIHTYIPTYIKISATY